VKVSFGNTSCNLKFFCQR